MHQLGAHVPAVTQVGHLHTEGDWLGGLPPDAKTHRELVDICIGVGKLLIAGGLQGGLGEVMKIFTAVFIEFFCHPTGQTFASIP